MKKPMKTTFQALLDSLFLTQKILIRQYSAFHHVSSSEYIIMSKRVVAPVLTEFII